MTTTPRILLGLTMAILVCPIVASSQTAAQQLQKGIFTEDSVGDLDGAIAIYRQILAMHPVPHQIETQTRDRLGESLRKKAPALQPAAAQEQPATGCCGMFSGNYDASNPVTVSGTIRTVMWVNPQTIVLIDGTDGNRWGFTLPPPNALVLRGMTRDAFKPGEMVTVRGYLAKGVGDNCPTTLPNACAQLARVPAPSPAAGRAAADPDVQRRLAEQTASVGNSMEGAVHASASSITALDGRNLFDWVALQRTGAQQ